MRLRFDSEPSRNYPHGYWYAVTDDGGWDADGATPLDAISALVQVLERHIYQMTERENHEHEWHIFRSIAGPEYAKCIQCGARRDGDE